MKVRLNNHIELKNYFEALLTEFPEIKTFQYGGHQKIVKNEVAVNEYPLLFLAVPDVRYRGSLAQGTAEKGFDVSFNVMINSEHEIEEQEEAAMLSSETITAQIVQKIAADFRMKSSLTAFNSQPVLGAGGDNTFGYMTTLILWTPFSC